MVAATAGATGLRAWIGAHRPPWMTPRRMRALSTAIVLGGVVSAGALA